MVESEAAPLVRHLLVEGVEGPRGGGNLGGTSGEGDDARIERGHVSLECFRRVALGVDGHEHHLQSVPVGSETGEHVRPVEQRGGAHVRTVRKPEHDGHRPTSDVLQ